MRMRIAFATSVMVAWLGVSTVATAATAPATAESPDMHLSATVTEVVGLVEVRHDDDQPWQEATVGMVVPVGSECRTGPKSWITMTLPPAQVIKLDRLGTVKILEAIQKGGKLKTDLGMKYGRIRYHQEAAGLEHESIIRSPSSALAVRGSDVEKTDYALMSEIRVYQGYAERWKAMHPPVTLGTGPANSYGERPVEINEHDATPALHAANQAAPPFVGGEILTFGEKVVATAVNNVSGMGMGMRQPQDVQRPLVVQPQVLGSPGTLLFDLNWVGDGTSGITPDLDLFVWSPKKERLVHGTTSPSGGTMSKNDVGGTQQASGHEWAQWSKAYPLGTYTYGAKYVGRGDPATFKINVMQNGKQINPDFIDTVHEGGRLVKFTIDLGKTTPPAARKRK